MDAQTQLGGMVASARSWIESQVGEAERLRPMLAVAAAVLFFGLLIAGFGLASSKVQGLRTAQTELARLQQQLKDGSWTSRKQESETLRFQLKERFWTAETAGLAEASLERWLRERIEKQEVRPDNIRIQRSAVQVGSEIQAGSALAGVQRMTAKVVMPFEPEALMVVLREAATNQKILTIDRLLIRSGRNPLIEMDISTFVLLPEATR